MNKPIKNCYWVIDGEFLAGEYPRSISKKHSLPKLKAFLEFGIECFIDLTENDGYLEPYSYLVKNLSDKNITIKNFPIVDMSIPNTPEYTKEILNFIDESLGNNKKVYVHCWGGIGRTGTIVGCWLSRHGFRGEKALVRLKELWRHCYKSTIYDSPQTIEQTNYVINWSE